MAYTTIDDPSAFFHVNLHTGNETNNTDITFNANAGDFQPDWIWFKGRTSSAIDHALFDSSRGTTKILSTNNTDDENAQGSTLKAFNSNGFRVGDDAGDYGVNKNGRTYVTWNWKANGGTTSSNTDGSVTTTVQANTTAGFSIVTWTETTANSQTIGHGLGKTPAMIITKLRDNSVLDPAWYTFHQDLGTTERIMLDSTSGDVTTSFFDGTLNSSVFHVGYGDSYDNTSVVAYCFAEIKGYSKFGSYTGNANADGTFVYTGFKPAFVMTKRTDSSQNWAMYDNKRNDDSPAGANVIDRLLYPNANDAEVDTGGSLMVDFLSNGFKWRGNSAISNGSGNHIYMAFAEHPFVSSKGVPVTAR